MSKKTVSEEDKMKIKVSTCYHWCGGGARCETGCKIYKPEKYAFCQKHMAEKKGNKTIK